MENKHKPASPYINNIGHPEDQEYYYGLSKVEKISAMLMQGIISNPSIIKKLNGTMEDRQLSEDISKFCVFSANVMLSQCSKEIAEHGYILKDNKDN